MIRILGLTPSRGRAFQLAVGLAVVFGQPAIGKTLTRHDGLYSRGGSSRSAQRSRRAEAARALGDRIVAYAASLQGRQVGDGECFSLAAEALTHAGARTAYAYGAVTPDADYVWGRPVSLTEVLPGDIVQFRDFHIFERTTTLTRLADGSVETTQSEQVDERDHHTAIVERNDGDTFSLLEQNVDPAGRVVQRSRIAIRPHIEEATSTDAAQRTVTAVTVEGEVRAFRPEVAGK